MTSKRTSWTYHSLAWVTPRLAGRAFCGLASLTIILFFLSIFTKDLNNTYSYLFMIMLPFTFLAGIFGAGSWYIDKSRKDEESRIQSRWSLHFCIFCGLFLALLNISQLLH
jgi:hypothetical protein